MGRNVDLCQMLGVPRRMYCPNCGELADTRFDDKDIDFAGINDKPGEWRLQFFCDFCETSRELKITVKLHYEGWPNKAPEPWIPLVKAEEPGMEPCCFCGRLTGLWTALKDRSEGEQVACCIPCGSQHKPSEVPTKDQWFAKHQRSGLTDLDREVLDELEAATASDEKFHERPAVKGLWHPEDGER